MSHLFVQKKSIPQKKKSNAVQPFAFLKTKSFIHDGSAAAPSSNLKTKAPLPISDPPSIKNLKEPTSKSIEFGAPISTALLSSPHTISLFQPKANPIIKQCTKPSVADVSNVLPVENDKNSTPISTTSSLDEKNNSVVVEKKWIDDFVENYQPKVLSDLVGNEKTIHSIREWIQNDKYKKPIALIQGPVGCGKTSIVQFLINEYQFDVYEFSLSNSEVRDDEDYDSLPKNRFTTEPPKSKQESIIGKVKQIMNCSLDEIYETTQKRLILFDGYDQLSSLWNSSSRSGIVLSLIQKRIIQTNSSIPMVLICNELSTLELKLLKEHSLVEYFRMNLLDRSDVNKFLKPICKTEGWKLERSFKEYLFESFRGDLRMILYELSILHLIQRYNTHLPFSSFSSISISKKENKWVFGYQPFVDKNVNWSKFHYFDCIRILLYYKHLSIHDAKELYYRIGDSVLYYNSILKLGKKNLNQACEIADDYSFADSIGQFSDYSRNPESDDIMAYSPYLHTRTKENGYPISFFQTNEMKKLKVEYHKKDNWLFDFQQLFENYKHFLFQFGFNDCMDYELVKYCIFHYLNKFGPMESIQFCHDYKLSEIDIQLMQKNPFSEPQLLKNNSFISSQLKIQSSSSKNKSRQKNGPLKKNEFKKYNSKKLVPNRTSKELVSNKTFKSQSHIPSKESAHNGTFKKKKSYSPKFGNLFQQKVGHELNPKASSLHNHKKKEEEAAIFRKRKREDDQDVVFAPLKKKKHQ